MEKIKVQICLGTTCFVMGASDLQNMSDKLSGRFGDKVEVVAVACLGACNEKSSFSKAPFVKVGDVLIAEANFDKIVDQIEKQLSDK